MYFSKYLTVVPLVCAQLTPQLYNVMDLRSNSLQPVYQEPATLTTVKSSAQHTTTSPSDIISGSASAVPTSTHTRHLQQQASKHGLIPGEVFGIVTLSNNPLVDKETVVIYNDGTLGIKEPGAPGYLFEALLLEEYGLMLAPEPLTTVKLNDKNVFFLNDSLFNPAPIFSSKGWDLLVDGGSTIVCPSWNSVLTYVPQSELAPCDDAIDVSLRIVPIAGEEVDSGTNSALQEPAY